MEQEKDKCGGCRYRSPAYSELYTGQCGCDFAYITGCLRGCPADERCTRFEPGPRQKPRLLGPVRRQEDAALLERILRADRGPSRRKAVSRKRRRAKGWECG